jgi:hypothetical protein
VPLANARQHKATSFFIALPCPTWTGREFIRTDILRKEVTANFQPKTRKTAERQTG